MNLPPPPPRVPSTVMTGPLGLTFKHGRRRVLLHGHGVDAAWVTFMEASCRRSSLELLIELHHRRVAEYGLVQPSALL